MNIPRNIPEHSSRFPTLNLRKNTKGRRAVCKSCAKIFKALKLSKIQKMQCRCSSPATPLSLDAAKQHLHTRLSVANTLVRISTIIRYRRTLIFEASVCTHNIRNCLLRVKHIHSECKPSPHLSRQSTKRHRVD